MIPLLVQAAWEGNLTAVIARVKAGDNIEAKDPLTGTPALIAATHSRNPAMVKFLLEQGANPNATDGSGQTALHHAADRPRTGLTIVRYLLAAGGDVQKRCKAGRTAFINAARMKHNAILLPVLQRAGALVDSQSDDGLSALMWACVHQHTAGVAALLLAGANPSLCTPHGNHAMLFAARSQNAQIDILEALAKAERGLIHIPNNRGHTPLMVASATHTVEWLLANGVNPHVRDINGHNALHWAHIMRRPPKLQQALAYALLAN